MAEEWEERYREKLRELLRTRGRKVQTSNYYDRAEADDDLNVSPYGWVDYNAEYHILGGYTRHGGPCEWVVPEGAVAYERTYSEFQDTLSDNARVVGINVNGCHCKCGKYTDVYLRWEGSIADAVKIIMGVPDTTRSIQL